MKEYIKDTYKIYLYTCCIILILLFPMPYYISNGGGIDSLDKKITIDGAYKSKGSFNLSYVTEIEGNVSSFILSYFMPNWERTKINTYKIVNSETTQDINNRGRISLSRSNKSSVYVAYTKAGKTITLKSKDYYIYLISNSNIKKIKIGDKLIKVNDIDNPSLEDVKNEVINSDIVNITVLRDDKEIEEEIVPFYDEKNNKYIGISFILVDDYETDPEITFDQDKNESGGSAGLMMALEIYNQLTKFDYTRGLKIAGTGTISSDGTVGEIAGVNYKLAGAVYGKADIFLVPDGDNYKEALELKEKNDYKIDIVPVKTFDDAIEYLKNLKK